MPCSWPQHCSRPSEASNYSPLGHRHWLLHAWITPNDSPTVDVSESVHKSSTFTSSSISLLCKVMDFSPDTTRSQSFEQSRHHVPFPDSFRVSESATPMSGPGSVRASTTAFHLPTVGSQKYFRSRRIKDTTTISKPWMEKTDKQAKWHTIIPVIGVIAGVALVGLSCWQGYMTVPRNTYCSVYDVDFTTGGQLDPKIWTKEVQLGGFGYTCYSFLMIFRAND